MIALLALLVAVVCAGIALRRRSTKRRPTAFPSLDDFEALVRMHPGAEYRRARVEGVTTIAVKTRTYGDSAATDEALREVEERARAAGYDVAREGYGHMRVTARKAGAS